MPTKKVGPAKETETKTKKIIQTLTNATWKKVLIGIIVFIILPYPLRVFYLIGLSGFVVWYIWIKGSQSKNLKIGQTIGISLVMLIVLSALATNTTQKQDKQTVSTSKPTETTQSAQPTTKTTQYEFISTKNETASRNENKMDLYYYSGEFNLEEFKALCGVKRKEFTKGAYYFLVLFDTKENATYPNNPFTALYGAEEAPQKHIKAVYNYSNLNGYSKLDYYDKNAWESTVKTVDIQ